MDNAGLVFDSAPRWGLAATPQLLQLTEYCNGDATGGHDEAEDFTSLSDGCGIEADRIGQCQPRHVSDLPRLPTILQYKIGGKLAGTLEHNS